MPGMAVILALTLMFQAAGAARPRDPVTLAVGDKCEWISHAQPELVPVAQACEAAFQMRDNMPDFVCDLKVKRTQVVPMKAEGRTTSFSRKDTVTAEVTYENGHEQFTNVRINGKPADDTTAASTLHWTSGEFAPPALNVFRARSIASFALHDEKKTKENNSSGPRLDFDFFVPEPNEAWRWNLFGRSYSPAFHGTVSIDKQTGFVRTFTMIADGLPADVPYSRVQDSTDYESVTIAGLGVYQLPVRVVVSVCRRGVSGCDENIKEFSNCHRFVVKHRIITDPDIGPPTKGTPEPR